MATVGTALKALRKVDRELGETLDEARKANPEANRVFECLAEMRVSVQQEIGRLKDSAEEGAEDEDAVNATARPVERKVVETHGKPADSAAEVLSPPPSPARPVFGKDPVK